MAEPSVLELMFTDKNLLYATYSGQGRKREQSATNDSFSFSADLPPMNATPADYDGRHDVFNITTKLKRTGEDRFELIGQIKTKHDITLRFTEISLDGEFGINQSEVNYGPGTHDVKLKGTIEAWLSFDDG